MELPDQNRPARRTVLKSLGTVSITGMIGLAGCTEDEDGAGDGAEESDTNDTGGGSEEGGTADNETDSGDEGMNETDNETEGDDNGSNTLSGSDYPEVDEWLTETEIGDEAQNYDGTILDRREEDAVEVEVGTGDTGLQFEPPAVAVSPGTTVRWVWTGQGGAHNVVAGGDEQNGESDYEFSSGDPVDEEGETYEQTLEDPGNALYYCRPHLTVGMKGAVIVE